MKSNQCYTSLVRPILEYAATIWSPHLQYQKHQIEKVQCSAARFVTGDFSYHSSVTNMLIQLKWPLLEQRRNFLKLTKYYTALLIPQSHLLPSQHQPVDTANVLLPLLLELTHIQIPSYLLLLICGILYLIHWLIWMI